MISSLFESVTLTGDAGLAFELGHDVRRRVVGPGDQAQLFAVGMAVTCARGQQQPQQTQAQGGASHAVPAAPIARSCSSLRVRTLLNMCHADQNPVGARHSSAMRSDCALSMWMGGNQVAQETDQLRRNDQVADIGQQQHDGAELRHACVAATGC